MYFSFLRIYKNKEFITQDNWDFLYSLEIYRHKFEEFWMITNIMSQDQNLQKILRFYLNCRAIFIEILGSQKYVLLDDLSVDYNSLHLIMNAVFKEKATTKMHLIQKLKPNAKGKMLIPASNLMSSILIDWLTNLTKTFSSNKKKFVNIIKKANKLKTNAKRKNRFQIPYNGAKMERAGSCDAKLGKLRDNWRRRGEKSATLFDSESGETGSEYWHVDGETEPE